MEATAVREVSNADRSVYLFDLYNNDGGFYYEPCLVFEYAKTDSCWDNSDYVYNFLRRLNKNKKDIDDNITFDEREKLLTIYLREAEELCSSFSYNTNSSSRSNSSCFNRNR